MIVVQLKVSGKARSNPPRTTIWLRNGTLNDRPKLLVDVVTRRRSSSLFRQGGGRR